MGRGIDRYLAWTAGSVNKRIFSAAIIVGFIGILVRLVAIAKELGTAAVFGRSDALEEFLIALLPPTILASILSGSLHQVFQPIYAKVRKEQGDEAAKKFFGQIMTLMISVLIILGFASVLGSRWLIERLANGFGPEKLNQTISLSYWLLPVCSFSALSAVLGSLLNVRGKFSLVAITPFVTPFAVLLAIFWWGNWAGALPLAIATVIGAGIEFLWLILYCGKWDLGFSLVRIEMSGPCREVIMQWWPVLFGSIFQSGVVVVGQFMAAGLESGSVAGLGYASRAVNLPMGLLTAALATAFFPMMSNLAASKQWVALEDSFSWWMRRSLWGGFAISIGIMTFSFPIVRVLFERGRFTSVDSAEVALLLCIYAAQIPAYTTGILGVRMLSVYGSNRVLLLISLVNFAAAVFLNAALVPRLGVVGIALASTLVGWLSLVQILMAIARNNAVYGRRLILV